MVDRQHIEGLLDNVPSALITLDDDRTVLYRNRAGRVLTPMIKPGMDVWDCLRGAISEEKIDRLLLNEDRVIFAAAPDLPLLEWLVSPERLADGSRILMAWDADILDEIVQRRITFVVGASHELRSPMTALLGFAEILHLEADTLSPTQAEAAEVILENARHLHSLIDDILDMTRVSFGELRLYLEKIEVGPIVSGVVETLRPQMDKKDQVVSLTIKPGVPPIEADPSRIRQVALNLIQNANEHSPPGSSIEVSVRCNETDLVFAVADDGDGLPFEDPDEAFAEFERGTIDTNSRVSGAGIGLTITKGIVELHRGSIAVKSKPGEGTTFEVLLPLDRESARKRIFAGEK